MLRYAFLIAETTFDSAQISDLYSRTVVAGMIEAPLEFEFLAKPARMQVNTAAAMPEVSEDFKTFTFRIQPGIYFAARQLDGQELRWGLEHIALDEARLVQIGALELLHPLALSCRNHEGGGAEKFQQWLGTRWNVISDWVSGDHALVRQMVEEAAAAYARERGIHLRDCSTER